MPARFLRISSYKTLNLDHVGSLIVMQRWVEMKKQYTVGFLNRGGGLLARYGIFIDAENAAAAMGYVLAMIEQGGDTTQLNFAPLSEDDDPDGPFSQEG